MKPSDVPSTRELDRIRNHYTRLDRSPERTSRYGYFNRANLFLIQSRQRAVIDALREGGLPALPRLRVLEVGCGTGTELRNLVQYGADPSGLHGVDVLEDRVRRAIHLTPGARVGVADASYLPFPDARFDLVTQFTVFSSILDITLRRQVAGEMVRVLKPGGAVLWYDYHISTPSNPDVRGISRSEVRRLFSNCDFRVLRRVNLAPPLTRALMPLSWTLCQALEQIPWLRAYYVGLFIKPA